MNTIANVFEDINRGCFANNLIENCFSYRIVFYVNEKGIGTRHYVDTPYGGLWEALGNIIRENLTTTNAVVISAVTVRQNGESISLLDRAYGFDLGGYFRKVCEGREKDSITSFGCAAR